MDKYRTPISAAAVLLSPVSCGASHPGEDTQETLALSIASYKDGPSPLLDVGAQRSVATAQASLARAVQQTAKDHVVPNMARGRGYIVDAAIRPTSYEHCDSCHGSDRWEIDQPATRSGLINGLHV